jgi:hypothetical protein
MTGFAALVRLSLRDLSRRRILWVLGFLLLGGFAASFWIRHLMERMVIEGASVEIVTRKANQTLKFLADRIRETSTFAVILVAAIVAPESRRNGTTQFVLAAGVGRLRHAASQFLALSAFVAAGALVVHGGFFAAAANVGPVKASEVLLAWALLLAPLLAVASAVFSMSLTLSTIEVLLLFIAEPVALRAMADMAGRFLPLGPVRVLESAVLLFPNPTDATPWPHLALAHGPPAPDLVRPAVHALLAAAFWTAWGLVLLRRHDFGSRTAIK